MKKIKACALAAAVALALTACGSRGNAPTSANNGDGSATSAVQKADSTRDEPRIEFSMTDIDGKEVNVTDEFAKHKITLIDFWASWCGPCMQEMPNLVRIYGKYKDKGLGIVGVSLDEDKSQWTEAVSSMGMVWTQLSDLQGWNNSAAQKYGIQAIPFTVVVDSTGKVLDAGLRGEQLETEIAKLLGDK